MKLFTTSLLLTAISTSAALATVDIGDIDVDNDDFASFEEMTAFFPDLSQNDFDTIDDNNDNRVSSKELYETEAMDILARSDFDPKSVVNVDTNKDGFATYEEITVVFEGLSPNDFDLMDINDDNRLSQFEVYDTEAQTILARYPFMESVEDVQAIDMDGDKFLSLSELQNEFEGLANEEFEQIDTNNDNRVSFNELYAPEAQQIVSRYED